MLRSFRLALVSLTILAFLPSLASAQGTPFTVGTASAAPGQEPNSFRYSPERSPKSRSFETRCYDSLSLVSAIPPSLR
jgi:hypothetical protein